MIKELLVWFILFGGVTVEGALLALILRYLERRKERKNTIYYLYSEHMEKSSDVHRRHK